MSHIINFALQPGQQKNLLKLQGSAAVLIKVTNLGPDQIMVTGHDGGDLETVHAGNERIISLSSAGEGYAIKANGQANAYGYVQIG